MDNGKSSLRNESHLELLAVTEQRTTKKVQHSQAFSVLAVLTKCKTLVSSDGEYRSDADLLVWFQSQASP